MNNLEYEKSRKILKSATEKKETDIEGAITLIKEAIKICPEKILDDYFKLANYYYIANKKDQTFGLLEKLINDFDINEIGMYNMNKSLVNDKLCILHYKGNDYVLYLKNYSFWLYNTAVAFACQGRASELKNIIENPNKLDYLAPTKVNNCFKKLNKELIKEKFNNKLNTYLASLGDLMKSMAITAYKANFPERGERIYLEEIPEQTADKLLLKEYDFMRAFQILNSNNFISFYENELAPMIMKQELL